MVRDRGLPSGNDKRTVCPECKSSLVPTGLVEEPFDTYTCENCGYQIEIHPGRSGDEGFEDGADSPFP